MIIYKTTNLINSKIYVGYDTKEDPNYLGSGSSIQKAVIKYGKENFKKTTIDSSDDFDELCLKEKFWIKFYNAQDHSIGYNIANGGLGNKGWVPSEEVREKIAEKLLGRRFSKNARTKMSKARQGKILSESTRRKISCAMKNRRLSAETRQKMSFSKTGANNPNYGKQLNKKPFVQL